MDLDTKVTKPMKGGKGKAGHKRKFVYLLRSRNPEHMGSPYTGITQDMNVRIKQHNTSKKVTSYTFRKRPWVVVAMMGPFSNKFHGKIEYGIKHDKRPTQPVFERHLQNALTKGPKGGVIRVTALKEEFDKLPVSFQTAARIKFTLVCMNSM